MLRYLTDPIVASIGLGALAAAVMSSIDSSVLSASSMGAWNVYRPLVNPSADSATLARMVRRLMIIVGTAATLIALRVQSVYALWSCAATWCTASSFPN